MKENNLINDNFTMMFCAHNRQTKTIHQRSNMACHSRRMFAPIFFISASVPRSLGWYCVWVFEEFNIGVTIGWDSFIWLYSLIYWNLPSNERRKTEGKAMQTVRYRITGISIQRSKLIRVLKLNVIFVNKFEPRR